MAELPSPGIRVLSVYGIGEWVEKHQKSFEDAKAEVIRVTPKELERLSNLITPNQVVALCQIPSRDISEIGHDGVILALDGIRDPGNMGTIIRTADWFGINKIICSSDCVDLYNPKTIQATMGSFTRVKVYYTDLPAYLSNFDQEIYATVLDGKSIWDLQSKQGVFLIGNESNGIRPEVMQYATQHISIPSSGKAESLNAAIAAGIVMAHLQRGIKF